MRGGRVMGAATMRRIDALLHERRRLWETGGNRDKADRISRELAALYDRRRRETAGRAGQPYLGTTTRWWLR
jgi:hypothetical protein